MAMPEKRVKVQNKTMGPGMRIVLYCIAKNLVGSIGTSSSVGTVSILSLVFSYSDSALGYTLSHKASVCSMNNNNNICNRRSVSPKFILYLCYISFGHTLVYASIQCFLSQIRGPKGPLVSNVLSCYVLG